jgi:hypothetical protein
MDSAPARQWLTDRSYRERPAAAGGWSADRRAVDAVLRADPAAPPDVLAALTLTVDLRADADRAEERLIAMAREQGASWREVAAALGLHSRQAAEQRWLRLRAATTRDPVAERARRARLRSADTSMGPELVRLRDHVAALHEHVARRPDWEDHAAAAGLARRTLAAALAAPPGGLYDLARLAVDDLAAIPARLLGRPAAALLAQVAALVNRRLR